MAYPGVLQISRIVPGEKSSLGVESFMADLVREVRVEDIPNGLK